jgi:hypothetical protein
MFPAHLFLFAAFTKAIAQRALAFDAAAHR